jgi:hypothetical protein
VQAAALPPSVRDHEATGACRGVRRCRSLPPPGTLCSISLTHGCGDIGSVRSWAIWGMFVQIRGSAFVMAKRISQSISRLLFLSLFFMHAAIVLAPEFALGAEIPKEFRGNWCAFSKDISGDWGAYSSEISGCDDFVITIDAADLKSADQSLSCVIRDVRRFDVCPWGMIFKNRERARKKRPFQINPWSPGYHMVFGCTDSGGRSKVVGVDWVIEKGGIRGDLPADYRCPWDKK